MDPNDMIITNIEIDGKTWQDHPQRLDLELGVVEMSQVYLSVIFRTMVYLCGRQICPLAFLWCLQGQLCYTWCLVCVCVTLLLMVVCRGERCRCEAVATAKKV